MKKSNLKETAILLVYIVSLISVYVIYRHNQNKEYNEIKERLECKDYNESITGIKQIYK